LNAAIPQFEKANALDSPPWVTAYLGYTYAAVGENRKAREMIGELHRKSLHGYVPPYNLAIVYLGMGDRGRALDGLEKAYAAQSLMLTYLKMEKIFDPLRSEPRFITLLKKVHLDR
jgi:adenylate cyclase